MNSALLLLLATRLLAGRDSAIRPELSTSIGTSIACVGVSQAEVHRGRKHVYVCVDGLTGEVRGSVLKPNGVAVCDISGFADISTNCLTLSSCLVSGTQCS